MFVARPGHQPDFTGSTLIIPALSIGNVGQFAIDTMVPTLNVPGVGYLEHESVLPVVGNDAFSKAGSGVLSTSIEVYHTNTNTTENRPSITLIQQRSPVVKGHNIDYATSLLNFVKSSGFKETVLLLSTDASHRIDSQLFGPQVRFILSTPLEESGERAEQLMSLDIQPMEDYSFDQTLKPGTLAHILYDLFTKENLPLTILVQFVHEGYNIPDGIQMATWTCRYLKLFTKDEPINWVLPSSWRHVLKSPAFDKRLFV